MVNSQPEHCAVAFKEWAGVCDALFSGRQSLLVRKGGISEGAGPGVFTLEHSEFWLYPTWVHQAQQGLRSEAGELPPAHNAPAGGSVPIRVLVRVELIGHVESEDKLRPLEELHVFTALTLAQRFRYRKPGLWILALAPGGMIRASKSPRPRNTRAAGHGSSSIPRWPRPGSKPCSMTINGPRGASTWRRFSPGKRALAGWARRDAEVHRSVLTEVRGTR